MSFDFGSVKKKVAAKRKHKEVAQSAQSNPRQSPKGGGRRGVSGRQSEA